jgi:hypothetical protein
MQPIDHMERPHYIWMLKQQHKVDLIQHHICCFAAMPNDLHSHVLAPPLPLVHPAKAACTQQNSQVHHIDAIGAGGAVAAAATKGYMLRRPLHCDLPTAGRRMV